MSRAKRYTDIPDVVCIHETAKALLVQVEGKEVWVPKSVVSDDSEVFGKGHSGTFIIEEWLAVKEGWDLPSTDGDYEPDPDMDFPGHPGDFGDQD